MTRDVAKIFRTTVFLIRNCTPQYSSDSPSLLHTMIQRKNIVLSSLLVIEGWDVNVCKAASIQNVTVRPKKVNYMFLMHCPRHFQPPASKIFIAF